MYDFHPKSSAADLLVGLSAADVERDLIFATLRQTEGNRTHAASILQISIRTLRNKLNSYAEQGFEVPASGALDG